MSGYKDFISVNIIGLDEAVSRLNALPATIDAALHERTVLEGIGGVLQTSARQTIDEGGRPTRYKPLAQSTINRRWNKEQKKAPVQRKNKQGIVSNDPLNNTGELYQSLRSEFSDGELFLVSKGYLKYHQFEEGRTKARFPARPVWGVQDEDNAEITDIIVAGIQRNL
ncbi:MAG: phage virion morphogenesis protein [Chlorobiaceae bacterium]